MEYIEVSIRIQPYTDENADIVLSEIDQLGFESYVNEEPFLKAYIQKEKFCEQHLKAVLSAFKQAQFFSDAGDGTGGAAAGEAGAYDGIAVGYSLNLIPEQNWNAAWEADFQPVVIGRLCTVKAPYHHGLPRTRYSITIKPEMAFGTGHHQTTTMMAEYLLSEAGILAESADEDGCIASIPSATSKGRHPRINLLKEKQLLDMGCGTGILSILAAKLHSLSPVHAIDIDPVAVRSARENAAKNRTADAVKTLCGDASLIQAGKYDYILANINRNILLEDMSTYVRGLKLHGTLIISGFYTRDIPLLTERAAELGLSFSSRREKENWAAVKFVK